MSSIKNDIVECVGNTPAVRINRIGHEEGLECEFIGKCEFFNPGGSVKDRIARRMVEDAASSGRITVGQSTLLEPTSGNTGVGLALCGAVRGYNVTLTMPMKMSNEKIAVIKALGANVVRTPTEAAWDDYDSHIKVAERMRDADPDVIILDQYINKGNPNAHYDTTGEEIFNQCDGKVDMVVIGAGTGGTVTGVGKKLKEKLGDKVKIVAVDPDGSILHDPQNAKGGSYQMEGIGYDFVPQVLEHSVIDDWVVVNDLQAFSMARRLIKSEGFLCGGSSGAAMYGAIVAAKKHGMKKGDRVVVLLPDSIRNYITKFINDNWMVQAGLGEAIGKPDQPELDQLSKIVQVQGENDNLKLEIEQLKKHIKVLEGQKAQ